MSDLDRDDEKHRNQRDEQHGADVAEDEAGQGQAAPCSPVCLICFLAIWPQMIAGMKLSPMTNPPTPQTSAAMASPLVGAAGG